MCTSLLRRLSIKSQLLILLLTVGLVGIILVSLVAYENGKKEMKTGVFSQLSSIREAKANRIQAYMGRVQAHVATLGEDEMIVKGMAEFHAAFQQASNPEVSPEKLTALKDFYSKSFLPKLAANSEGQPELETYFPGNPQSQFFQALFLLGDKTQGRAEEPPVSEAGVAYAQVHDRLHPVLQRLVKAMRYEDLLLISPAGEVVYSVAKNPEFATNLRDGPYSETNLAKVFEKTHHMRDHGEVAFADFTFYPPTANAPAAFFTTPIIHEGQLIGVLALQLCIEEINFVMTGNKQWEKEGLRQTGEFVLVGEDDLMRSDSRFLFKDRQEFLQRITENGIKPEIVERIDRHNTTILYLPVRTDAVRFALSGHTDAQVLSDYRGEKVLSAFQPVSFADTRWALIAKMDYDEAFAPVITFERQVVLYSAGFVVVVTLIALWLTSRFVRPITVLTDAIIKVGEGQQEVRVEDDGLDEIGVLARAFNGMLEKQRGVNEELRLKNRENEALLLNMLPAPIALRIKNGEQNIADTVASVTVLFADLIGFEDYSRATTAEELVGLLNEIVTAFDEAAERHGVEKVKTIGSVYMAVSGLSIPRIDHIHRMIGFARDLVEIIHRINQRHGLNLAVSVGINTGSAIAGIVGRQKFIYDLWGDTVTIAGRMQRATLEAGIRVTQPVKEALGDLHEFEPAGEFELPGRGAQSIWTLPTP